MPYKVLYQCRYCSKDDMSLMRIVDHLTHHYVKINKVEMFRYECKICHHKTLDIGTLLQHGTSAHRNPSWTFNIDEIAILKQCAEIEHIFKYRSYVNNGAIPLNQNNIPLIDEIIQEPPLNIEKSTQKWSNGRGSQTPGTCPSTPLVPANWQENFIYSQTKTLRNLPKTPKQSGTQTPMYEEAGERRKVCPTTPQYPEEESRAESQTPIWTTNGDQNEKKKTRWRSGNRTPVYQPNENVPTPILPRSCPRDFEQRFKFRGDGISYKRTDAKSGSKSPAFESDADVHETIQRMKESTMVKPRGTVKVAPPQNRQVLLLDGTSILNAPPPSRKEVEEKRKQIEMEKRRETTTAQAVYRQRNPLIPPPLPFSKPQRPRRAPYTPPGTPPKTPEASTATTHQIPMQPVKPWENEMLKKNEQRRNENQYPTWKNQDELDIIEKKPDIHDKAYRLLLSTRRCFMMKTGGKVPENVQNQSNKRSEQCSTSSTENNKEGVPSKRKK